MCEPNQSNDNVVIICKVLVVLAFLYPLIHYTFFDRSSIEETTTPTPSPTTEPIPETKPIPKPKPKPIIQPSCPRSYMVNILQEICLETFQCLPEDVNNLSKHRLPKFTAKNNTGEPRGTIVGCVAAGLLLTSLGAAFVELYKAKSQTVKTAKPTISRKCSLADLTVLKHNRKELVRRESIMEIPETKQLGFRPPPLYRRCSFPVGPIESCGSSYSTYQESRRSSTESRRLSIIDSRRNSVSLDCRKASIDVRRISIDNNDASPERRHWSRLVHRH